MCIVYIHMSALHMYLERVNERDSLSPFAYVVYRVFVWPSLGDIERDRCPTLPTCCARVLLGQYLPYM